MDRAVPPAHAADEPVADATDERPPDERALIAGTALCLSGGGYRAMLFHLGGIIRLNELGALRPIARVSSVSGGSITAATLGLAWPRLEFGPTSVATNLVERLVEPIRRLASTTIDTSAIIGGLLLPGRTIGQRVARAYDRRLFHGATLQDLPADGDGPRFVINATNVQTGKLYRFSQRYQGDYTVGLWDRPTTRLADAVAASSAFPPMLSPCTFAPSGTYAPMGTPTNDSPAFRSRLWMVDGGVYDNLGLETAWKACQTILVSDAGGVLRAEVKPKRNWPEHAIRVSSIVDGQVRALRKRQLIGGFARQVRSGTYWGVHSDVDRFAPTTSIPFPAASRERAQRVTTRLAALDAETQRALIQWGYVIADTSLRRWMYPHVEMPDRLPDV